MVKGAARLGADCGGGHGRPDREIGTDNCMLILLSVKERSFSIGSNHSPHQAGKNLDKRDGVNSTCPDGNYLRLVNASF